MAIAPPSDLLLDVARAADPVKLREATAKLARLAADPSATNEGFGKALAAAQGGKGQTSAAAPASASAAAVPPGATGAVTTRLSAHSSPADTYKKFEAVLLQNFVESILPKDDASFGDAASAGIYRSMMAEQLATQLAAAGGIGIAKSIAKAHPAQAASPSPPSVA